MSPRLGFDDLKIFLHNHAFAIDKGTWILHDVAARRQSMDARLTHQRQCETTTSLMKNVRTLGIAKVRALLPAYFEFYISDHDTGCQAWINLSAEGQETIRVWEGSIWHSSQYEWNDRSKVLGLKPGMEFCGDAITMFLNAIDDAAVGISVNRIANEEAKKLEEQSSHERSIAYYRSLLSDCHGK